MATLKDIAKEANVSVMTVSNVINGRHNKVSAQTINRVNALVEKHHFIPNQTARNLVGKSSRIIGLIVPYIGHNTNLATNPYNSEIIGELERILRKENYYLLLRSVKSLQEASVVLKTWNVDGAIFLGSFDQEMLSSSFFNPIPLIFLDNYTDHEHIMNVGLNDYAGEFEAVSYLIEKGHKKIAFASPPFSKDNLNVVERRFMGYHDALLKAGIPFEESYVYTCPLDYTSGVKLVDKVISQSPQVTAICTAADIIAMGILEGARNLGISVPKDLSVIGFDNLPATELVYPKLTSVQQDVQKKATMAAKLLLQQLQQKYIESTNIVLNLTLSHKESVSVPRNYNLNL